MNIRSSTITIAFGNWMLARPTPQEQAPTKLGHGKRLCAGATDQPETTDLGALAGQCSHAAPPAGQDNWPYRGEMQQVVVDGESECRFR
jgi:hypothetical protein